MGKKIKKILKFVLWSFVILVASSVVIVALYSFVPPPVTPHMVLRSIGGLFDGKFVSIDKSWRSYDEVSPHLYRAVIAAEDGKFMRHNGIDWKAVDAAKRYNERYKGKKKRGASTITMQTAKNTFLPHWRNYVRKAAEVYFTYLIEAVWGKKRILEVYVNIVEWGEGVYGAEAAAQKHFGKSAANLTSREAALLAAVLPNPIRWSAGKPTAYIKKRATWVQGRMGGIAIPKK